jgi:hypothetical protein
MLRNDKIASLPENIREQLHARLHNGESNSHLVDWLNDLPRVQTILFRKFDGNIITDGELAEWRYSGYEAWIIKKYESISLADLEKWSKEATREQLQDFLRALLRESFRTHLDRFMQEYRTLCWLRDAALLFDGHSQNQTETPSPAR